MSNFGLAVFLLGIAVALNELTLILLLKQVAELRERTKP